MTQLIEYAGTDIRLPAECPECSEQLVEFAASAGSKVSCPTCGAGFILLEP